MKPAHRKRESPPLTSEDIWLTTLRRQCADALAAWLKDAVDLRRPIISLSPVEIEGMAEAVTSRWIIEVSKKRQQPEESAAVASAVMLLI